MSDKLMDQVKRDSFTEKKVRACDTPETVDWIHGLEDEVADLTKQLSEKESERDNWMETARQHLKNEEFYRELVVQIGEKFGDIAYISDDGSVQEDVLCLKVPELVSDLTEQLTHQAEVFLEMVRAPMVPPQDSEVTE